MLIRQTPITSFKSSRFNIAGISDTHGNVSTLPYLVKNIEEHKDEIFIKEGTVVNENNKKTGVFNLFAVAGDWFINPAKRGFLSHPEYSNGDVQKEFFKETIKTVKDIAGEENFETAYTFGNHCFDGGDKYILDAVRTIPMSTIVSNVNLDKSPEFVKSLKENENLYTSKVFEVQDNKNPNLVNKILFLGTTIPSIQFYNQGLIEGLDFINDSSKKDVKIAKNDLKETYDVLNKEVEKFKKENPNGTVVLMSHMGQRLSKFICDEVPNIDVILNAHDHKNDTCYYNGTMIVSLGKDNEMLKSISLHYDDNGKLDEINTCMFNTDFNDNEKMEEFPLYKYSQSMFAKDVAPVISLSDPENEISELEYSDKIRYANSHLANYITSSIKRTLKLKGVDVDIVGVQSSNIRGGLKNNSNNLDVMKIFDGVSEKISYLNKGAVTGKELSDLVAENVKANLEAPTRSTLIQWSDIQVNKTLLADVLSGKSDKTALDCVKIRDKITREFVPIDKDKEYNVVFGDKILMKRNLPAIGAVADRFEPLGVTYDEIFREHLDMIDYDVRITDKVREERII